MPTSNHVCSTAMAALRIMEILKETDEQHPTTQKKIADALGYDRKAVARTLTIMENEMPEFEIGKCREGIYHIKGESDFDLYEIRMLTDSVLSSRIISTRETKTLLNKLGKLINRRERKHLHHIHTTNERIKVNHQETMLNIDMLGEAIDENKQVHFTYRTYDRNMRLVPIGEYQVSPYKLVFANGFYMLMCKDNDGNVCCFRIDMMKNIAKLEISSNASADIQNHPELGADLYIVGCHHMQIGKAERIEAEIKEDAIGRAIDTFGKDIKIYDAEDQGKLHIVFKANTEDVYLWALQNADVATVISPQVLRDRLRRTSATMNNAYLRYGQDHMNANYDAIVGNTGIRLSKYFSRPQLLMGDTAVRRKLKKDNNQDKVTHIIVNHFDSTVYDEMKEYVNVKKIDIPAFNEDYDGEQEMTNLDFLAPLENIEVISIYRDELTDISALLGMKNLRDISIHASITEEDAAKLRAAFPNAEIEIY